MKRKFIHYSIHILIRALSTLVVVGWLGTVIHLITI
jgi:hypothetical protein